MSRRAGAEGTAGHLARHNRRLEHHRRSHPVHDQSIGRRCIAGVWPDPAQRDHLAEIRDNLLARITEAEREGWLGEVEGLHISLAGAEEKLIQLDRRSSVVVDLGIPARRTPSS